MFRQVRQMAALVAELEGETAGWFHFLRLSYYIYKVFVIFIWPFYMTLCNLLTPVTCCEPSQS